MRKFFSIICLLLILLPVTSLASKLSLSTEKAHQNTISGAEMMEILDSYITATAPEHLPSWKQSYLTLRHSSEPLTRFEAMAALYLAAYHSGNGSISNDPFEEAGSLNHNWDEDYLRWDLFGGFENNSSFDIGGGDPMPLDGASYYFNLGRVSNGEHPFSVDHESNSLRVKDLATFTEASDAIMRLYESNSSAIVDFEGRTFSKTAVQAQEPRFVNINEVGTFNTDIITTELLNGCALKDVDKSALPYWTGYILENKIFANQYYSDDWERFNAGAKYFCEDEIRYLSENGFNCVRAVYSFCFLSNPNDINQINISELEQLDELISWGLKYNVHVMLSITGIPGVWGMSTEDENLNTNNTVFNDPVIGDAFARYWKMLSRRYAAIPNGVLSFELMAESDVPNHDAEINENLRLYCDYLIPIATSIWEDRDDRIVIVNDLWKNVPERMAEIGCCLSLHTHIYMIDERRLEEGYGIKTNATWPMVYMPNGAREYNGILKLLSDGGLSGVFRIYLQWNDGPKPYLRVDNVLTELREGRNKNNVLYWEADVPDGTKEISLAFHDGGGGGVLQVELERENGTIYLPTTEWAQEFQGNGKFPTIKVEPDGSLTCLEGEKIDGDFIFSSYIQPFTECARKNGVSYIMTEVGTDTLSLSPEEYIEYERVWLEMLKKHGIGWMYNCVHNILGPRTLIWYNGSNIKFQNFSQWEDTGYVVNDDVMNLLKEYR